MKPLPWPSALRTLCLSWVMVCSMSGVAHAQGPAVITDPHQQVEQLMRQDQIEPALAKIQAHLAQRPRDPQMRFWQAVLLTRQGKREQAMQVYTEPELDGSEWTPAVFPAYLPEDLCVPAHASGATAAHT